MLKIWIRFLPLSCGILLSLMSTIFIIAFVRGVHFQTTPLLFEIFPEAWFSLSAAFLLGTIGAPLTVMGMKRIDG